MKTYIHYPFYILFFFVLTINGLAQEAKVTIVLGEKTLPLNKPFTITVNIQNSEQRDVKSFPEIRGFQKRGQEASTATNTVSGKTVVSHRIVQNYVATKEGKYQLKAFNVVVNGQKVRSEGTIITVTTADKTQQDEEDFSDFISQEDSKLETTDDAFLALRVNTSRVFVGQGFTVKVALLVAETNTTEMAFPDDLGTQVAAMARKIQPPNCLIENFGLEEVQNLPIDINGKKYTEYKLYQAVYYPLNSQLIRFPEVTLQMKIAEKDDPKNTTFTTFTSKSFPVVPLELPLHPLRNQVSVGMFQLQESINKSRIGTGQSFRYEAHLTGEGNFAALLAPTIENDTLFDFYSPDIRQSLDRRLGRVTGDKTFTFQVIPKQAGTFALGKYFRWVYFNPQMARYDTLRSNLRIIVSGQKILEENTDLGTDSIYDGIEKLESSQQYIDYRELIKGLSNLLIIIMLIGMIFIFWKPKVK